MSTVFTPLTVGFSWVNATTDPNGNPLPPGEVESGTTIGIRADGDAAHSPGNYQYFVVNTGNVTSISAQAFQAAAKLPPGNYWAALDQTNILNGVTATGAFTSEIPFSIPVVVVKPAAPTNFTVA